MFGYYDFPEDDEKKEAADKTEPPKDKGPCPHHKVYAAKNESPFPWICSSCLATGEDEQYPVCDSNLFNMLHQQASGEGPSEEPGKIRPCYYCGKLVIGHFDQSSPVRCGKCI